ncbi:type I-F CRISPR-associated endoribonuclease Cas6/Csy4 [Acinetobacter gerneri]|uniref:Type I-F CRISPR-associated endoribonuclease Cas6/Csy4 n=1 Tax=Acinetobacter gerneri TaxID=202952 RepID=A0AAW8JID8_9GAMM|nr:type I-F CRISPR-associated endoribonuclease Cas6/Csy4 [Acinetobacter gerneri]MDQ9010572.1 type I-F CRISPR-associated endoribonuclease Cas6/Csy4 [Acinetobacter gerneri]MDQ9014771.1 type I-F CRISPR-associated endoribonuclease Cas6/Csy4 [Acinetobacter gerneri]MDQ9025891.1 type I-F CRISPR-associated endoribonuclease Cas6/Csy4 [Acinetobacter gerneri]MDQ9053223.1 type I-F CRISPR-associated endoribonuclease Cas6/Csy4 [Acinetobacter gerneri]MDQ9060790.1 type I-F CRISPR-associated endoribonuclease C
MQANFYIDIRILDSADDGELALAHLRNQIYNIVHGAFREMPERFALALEISPRQQRKMQATELKYGRKPPKQYDILRIFSAQKSELEQLIENIKNHWKIQDYAVLSQAALDVPTAKITGWKSYNRFRIPTLKMERNLPSNPEQKTLHQRRLEIARRLPYFRVKSQSTGQLFTVPIDIRDVELSDTKDMGNGLPDSYGLARQTQPFALPVFEVI